MRTGVRSFKLGATTFEAFADGTSRTILPDGREIPAAPQDTDDYRQRAEDLGYGDDTARMSQEHELGHSILAALFGMPASLTLTGVADGRYWKHWRAEEGAVLSLQHYARSAGISLFDVAERLEGMSCGSPQESPEPGSFSG
jgi:hypothetical protein